VTLPFHALRVCYPRALRVRYSCACMRFRLPMHDTVGLSCCCLLPRSTPPRLHSRRYESTTAVVLAGAVPLVVSALAHHHAVATVVETGLRSVVCVYVCFVRGTAGALMCVCALREGDCWAMMCVLR
jgi:hypothetical protein